MEKQAYKKTVLSGASLATNQTSLVTKIGHMDHVQYQYNVTSGTPVGTVQVQVSSDYAQDPSGNVTNAGTWSTVPSTVGVINGTGTGIIELIEMPQQWIRTIYTSTSGTGTMDAIVYAKSGL